MEGYLIPKAESFTGSNGYKTPKIESITETCGFTIPKPECIPGANGCAIPKVESNSGTYTYTYTYTYTVGASGSTIPKVETSIPSTIRKVKSIPRTSRKVKSIPGPRGYTIPKIESVPATNGSRIPNPHERARPPKRARTEGSPPKCASTEPEVPPPTEEIYAMIKRVKEDLNRSAARYEHLEVMLKEVSWSPSQGRLIFTPEFWRRLRLGFPDIYYKCNPSPVKDEVA